jgi:hypothetical protein
MVVNRFVSIAGKREVWLVAEEAIRWFAPFRATLRFDPATAEPSQERNRLRISAAPSASIFSHSERTWLRP